MSTIEDLERRYDGAIPARLRDIVIHGSRLKADIAELESLVKGFVHEVAFHKRAASSWRAGAGGEDLTRAFRLERAAQNDNYGLEAQVVLDRLTAQLTHMQKKDI